MRLTVRSFRILDEALEDAFRGYVDFEEVSRRLELRLTNLVGDSANDRAIRQALIEHMASRDKLAALVEAARAVNSTNQKLAAIVVSDLVREHAAAQEQDADDRTPAGPIRLEDVLARCLLSGGFFMIDRQPLRASIQRMLPAEGNRVLVVRGADESGMSHSLRMLYDLRDACRFDDARRFEIAEIDLDVAARRLGPGKTFSPVDLGRELARALEYDDEMLPRELDDKQWSAWIIDFVYALERRARRDDRRVYVVLDALNRVRLNQPTADLVAALGTSIGARLPHFRLVLVGFRAELPRAIRQAVLVDQTREITGHDLAAFFFQAHQEASVEIDTKGLLQKVANVLCDQSSAPPGTLLDLADKVRLELPMAVTGRA